MPDCAVSDRALHLPSAAGSERGGLSSFCDGTRAADSLRRGDDFHGQFPGANLLVLDGQRVFAVGLPVCLEAGVVEGPFPAIHRLSAA